MDYLARARACRSENQFNRLHIDLEGALAPAEIAAIGRLRDEPGFPAAGSAWLDSLAEREPALFVRPEPFARIVLHDHVTLFRGAASAPRRPRLLIAFTGVARRMMIPTAAFLQALDAREWDIVLLKWTGSFLDGAKGVADDLDGLLAYVVGKVGYYGYASISVLGVSGGGGPAAIAARKLGARRGVSMCGASSERLLEASTRPWPRARLLRRSTELRFVHGLGNEIDRAAARAMAAAWGGKVEPIMGVQSHNVMGALMKRGQLKPFLAEIL